MRRREPGFYVSVPAPAGMSSHPVELLDGPWPTEAAAERRASEILAGRPPGGSRDASVIQIGADGLTIIRRDDI